MQTKRIWKKCLFFLFVFVFADDVTGRSFISLLSLPLFTYNFYSIFLFAFVYRICATWLKAVHPLMRATQNQEKKEIAEIKTAKVDRRRKHRWIVIIIITSVWALEINIQNFGKFFLLKNFALLFCISFASHFRQIISGDSLSFDYFRCRKKK